MRDAPFALPYRAWGDAARVAVRKTAVVRALAARGLDVVDELEAARARDRARLNAVIAYAQSARCRWRIVREHFGEQVAADCGACDRCEVTLRRAS